PPGSEDMSSGPSGPSGIEPISIIEEMQRSYLDYAMSVIVSRALPDVRDGLKRVNRRILHAMNEMHLGSNRPGGRAGGVVGEVIGRFHLHRDASIHDALVSMAQDCSLRDPLVDGQANVGSIASEPLAALRYTECRLHNVTDPLLPDAHPDTADW